MPTPTKQDVWIWRGAVLAAAALAVIAGVLGCILGGIAFSTDSHFNHPHRIRVSGEIGSTPYVIHLDQATSPLAMTLPTELSSRVGNVYRIWSLTAQPHTITIGGGTGTTWDGTNTVATFGGSAGDGFVYEIISPNKIVIWSVTNVAFS